MIFEYLDSGKRKSIHFTVNENGMSILRKCLTQHGRYVNKNSRIIVNGKLKSEWFGK